MSPTDDERTASANARARMGDVFLEPAPEQIAEPLSAETLNHEPDPRVAALVKALVAARADLLQWLTPGDGDSPDAWTIAPRLLAAIPAKPDVGERLGLGATLLRAYDLSERRPDIRRSISAAIDALREDERAALSKESSE